MTGTRKGLPILAFADAAALEAWLEAAGRAHGGIWLKLARKGSGLASVSKSEAIDAALCHGWRMRAAGPARIAAAEADGRWQAAYAPQSKAEVPEDLRAALDASPKAAAFFAGLKGANRYAILYRIGAVKRPETRALRIAEFVAMPERGETVHG